MAKYWDFRDKLRASAEIRKFFWCEPPEYVEAITEDILNNPEKILDALQATAPPTTPNWGDRVRVGDDRGIVIDVPPGHPYTTDPRAQWRVAFPLGCDCPLYSGPDFGRKEHDMNDYDIFIKEMIDETIKPDGELSAMFRARLLDELRQAGVIGDEQ